MITSVVAFVGAVVFVFFAVVVQSFISMATPVGPWIEPIVALFMLLLVRGVSLFSKRIEIAQGTRVACLITVAAGTGGAVATAFGFSFPTLYFLDKALFNSWMESPFSIGLFASGITLVCGALAFYLVNMLEVQTLNNAAMPFPIGQMVGRVLSATQELKHSIMLVVGFALSFIFSIVQWIWQLIPQTMTIFSGATISIFRFPMLAVQTNLVLVFLAIGFIAGSLLVVPLVVGIVSKIILIEPLQKLFFPAIPFKTFLIAFAGGIMLQEAVLSLLKLPPLILSGMRWVQGLLRRDQASKDQNAVLLKSGMKSLGWLLFVFGIGIAYLSYYGFSTISQLYLYFFTVVCVQQALVIGGKAGMAPMGRYATFIMLPGLLLFNYSYTQAMMVSLFVWLVGMLTVDLFFGRVAGLIVKIDRRSIITFQAIGLVLSALFIGPVCWLLINSFGLDSPELCAQRAQARALLVTAWQFDPVILMIGALFGFILQRLKINPILVFTGLVIAEQFSLLLIAGGILALLVKNRADWEPFWSGVFAAGSLAMLLKVFI